MDSLSFSAAFTSIKAATDLAKILRQSVLSLKDAELNFKLAELMNALADAKVELAHLQDEAVDRDRAIAALQEKLRFQGQMTYEQPCYWQVDSDGKRDGPFCPRCWDVDRLAVRVLMSQFGSVICTECETRNVKSRPRRS